MAQQINRILHIEDDDGDAKQVRRDCTKEFGRESFMLERVDAIDLGLLKIKEARFDVILLDLNLGDGKGLSNLQSIKEQSPDTPVVVLSGHDDTETALEAIRGGAQEYIIKSANNSRHLGLAILSSIERKAYERHLYMLANQDELTGLHNRRAFNEYLKPWLIRAGRWQRTETIMFMDVNGFKQVNDTLGHDVGDLLLKQIAKTLRAGLRASDMLARFAGDEFIVHLDAPSHESKAISESVAKKISALFEQSVFINGHEITTGVSIGIATFPDHGSDAVSLIHSADQAMYQAKKAKISYVFFEAL
ncbi:MAG: diguanylate cyclase (GGDEF)-like protein [Oleispira sp.]|jgi:diguanylate cyclase (GGDEF)-like protein